MAAKCGSATPQPLRLRLGHALPVLGSLQLALELQHLLLQPGRRLLRLTPLHLDGGLALVHLRTRN